jgi:CubicO group peptidase (beta-lactamase class C family)
VIEAKKARLHRETLRLLEAGVAGRVFPGAVACVAFRHRRSWTYVISVAGVLEPGGPKTSADTIYDLASLTKMVVASTAMRMVEAGQLDLGARADEELSDLRGSVAAGATLEDLLSHRAGLDAWGGLYLDVPPELGASAARRWMLGEAGRRMHDEPEGSCVYSDLGYMLAGEMIGRAQGGTLAEAVRTHVTEPLGIADDIRYAGALASHERAALAKKAAPTERCEWRGRVVRCEPQDENCAALGGVAGHAGLFGTVEDVAALALANIEFLDEISPAN